MKFRNEKVGVFSADQNFRHLFQDVSQSFREKLINSQVLEKSGLVNGANTPNLFRWKRRRENIIFLETLRVIGCLFQI